MIIAILLIVIIAIILIIITYMLLIVIIAILLIVIIADGIARRGGGCRGVDGRSRRRSRCRRGILVLNIMVIILFIVIIK